MTTTHAHTHGSHHGAPEPHGIGTEGLAPSAHGYTFESSDQKLPGRPVSFRFGIRGPDGTLVRDFATRHERELHLIVVSHDLYEYAHLHPNHDSAGNWLVDLPRFSPGPHRLYADFAPASGPAMTLGLDATVSGSAPDRLPLQPTSAVNVEGFDAVLDGLPQAGRVTALAVRISRDGTPAELEPYLGANAHLVAIRAKDLAFLHVHPRHQRNAPGEAAFDIHLPEPGKYRLFVDFQVGGVVRTAPFTVDVPGADPEATR